VNKNSVPVLKMFAEKFRDLLCQPIYNLNQQFQRHGSMHDLPKSGIPRTSLTEENLTTVAQALVQSPKIYLEDTCGVHYSSYQCLSNCESIKIESVLPSSFTNANR
jgi:hypothetical protein